MPTLILGLRLLMAIYEVLVASGLAQVVVNHFCPGLGSLPPLLLVGDHQSASSARQRMIIDAANALSQIAADFCSGRGKPKIAAFCRLLPAMAADHALDAGRTGADADLTPYFARKCWWSGLWGPPGPRGAWWPGRGAQDSSDDRSGGPPRQGLAPNDDPSAMTTQEDPSRNVMTKRLSQKNNLWSTGEEKVEKSMRRGVVFWFLAWQDPTIGSKIDCDSQKESK